MNQKKFQKIQFSNSNTYKKSDINSQPQVTGGIGGILSNNILINNHQIIQFKKTLTKVLEIQKLIIKV